MRIRPFPVLGVLLLTAATASAQFVELVSEAPVVLSATLQTTTVSETASSRSATLTTTRLTQAQILEELRVAGIIPGASTTGWSLVAVRPPAADLTQVSASFALYAVNPTLNRRELVPASKFRSESFGSAAVYNERHQGQYVYDSRGTRTTHVSYDYRPTFSAAGSSFVVTSAKTGGFSRISFIARDVSDGLEVFTFAISSFAASTRGAFSATVTGNASPGGIMTLTVNVGAAKLVDATLYPDVDPNPFTSDL